jgi:P-type E1-E2 ATPase
LQPHHGPALEELRSRIPDLARSQRELFIIEDEQLIAIALLGESIRPAVAGLAPRLRALGLSLGIMTGDASPNEIRWTELGLRVSSGMTTVEKAAAVRALEARHEHVLFVGDGLNDSEAMAAASAGLLIHGGDATASAHAHGELSGSSLAYLPEAIALSRAACRQIRLILCISLLYNTAGLVLAATGWLNPIAAAAIMFASSLTVVALAARSGADPKSAEPRARVCVAVEKPQYQPL